ncbi:hypothetical protein DAI22_04g020000 [Oryza sativa Japonica Group]|nr:hypothetical protein DAI22_04g020000 [Oryza sativa Japonica Group]
MRMYISSKNFVGAGSGYRRRSVVEVAAAAPLWPSESELAAAEVAAVRVEAERQLDPPPPRLPPKVARHSHTRRHPCRISAGSAVTPSAAMTDTLHRDQIRAHGAQRGGRMLHLLTSRSQSPSLQRPQPCHAGSADAAPATARRWRWSRRASCLQSPVATEPPPLSHYQRERALGSEIASEVGAPAGRKE